VTLRDVNGTVLNYNNDWAEDNGTEICLTSIAPSNQAESAILMTCQREITLRSWPA
jgi:hypothetical protein